MIGWSRAVAYVLVAATVLVLVAIISLATSDSASAAPTCSDIEVLEVDVHGQHVLRDYVNVDAGIGPGHEGAGAAVPGGPGAGAHFEPPMVPSDPDPVGVAPGASFCLESHSPGIHLGP